MAKASLYNWQGEQTGSMDLPASVFDVDMSPLLVQQAVVAQAANARVALAHTKTKGEVRGGGRKPWQQKGTGRARQGSIRAPQWRGGGVVFGPRNDRNFTLKINKKARRRALQMTLSEKASQQKILVVEDAAPASGKTKEFEQALRKVGPLKERPSCLIVLSKKNESFRRASQNLPWVQTTLANSLNVRDVLAAKQVVLVKSALPVIEQTYGTLHSTKVNKAKG